METLPAALLAGEEPVTRESMTSKGEIDYSSIGLTNAHGDGYGSACPEDSIAYEIGKALYLPFFSIWVGATSTLPVFNPSIWDFKKVEYEAKAIASGEEREKGKKYTYGYTLVCPTWLGTNGLMTIETELQTNEGQYLGSCKGNQWEGTDT